MLYNIKTLIIGSPITSVCWALVMTISYDHEVHDHEDQIHYSTSM